jgi:hypothetical protein
MGRIIPILILGYFIFMLWPSAFAGEDNAEYKNLSLSPFLVSPDTVYQIDTVYQYEYVYDTIFYYDTIPQSDTAVSMVSDVVESDSNVVVNQTINIDITNRRTVYLDKNNTLLNLPGRTFRDPGESKMPDIDESPQKPRQSKPSINKTIKSPAVSGTDQTEIVYFPIRVRDTLYRFDTVFNYRTQFDTVTFERKIKSDTLISSQKTYQELGKSVLVKETVNVKVTERKDIFKDKNTGKGAGFVASDRNKNVRRSSTIVPSRYRASFDRTPRVGEQHAYAGNLRIGFSLINPDIRYSARKLDFEEEVDEMNRNHVSKQSYGLSFTYQYFKDHLGIETGVGFTKQNYAYDHSFQQIKTDTSITYEYFQNEIFQYDTTWYLDLDLLLQTGDTVFIPNVDSIGMLVTDSIGSIRVDTSYDNRTERYHYSLTFMEIPLIGHYSIQNRKFYLNLSGGFIPVFLISKSGNILYPESGSAMESGQVSFEYGFMLSIYGAVTLGYKFDKRWSFFVEPFVRRSIFSTVQNENIMIHTNSLGIKAGVSFRLFEFKLK